MTDIDQLKQALLRLLFLLRNLSYNQLGVLTRFEQCDTNIFAETINLEPLIQHSDDSNLEKLVQLAMKPNEERAQSLQEDPIQNVTYEQASSFGCLFRLLLLQQMIQDRLSVDQLMKVINMVPNLSADLQFQLLNQFQIILTSIVPERLIEIWKDFNQTSAAHQGESLLVKELERHQDQLLLEEPFRALFTMGFEDTRHIYEVFCSLYPIQLVQLVKLLQFEPLKILEIRSYLSDEGWKGLQSFMEDEQELDQMDMIETSSSGLNLTIVDQPPEQTVYKRNLKPCPTVLVNGDERGALQPGESLIVVPVLLRNDTMEPVAKISGNNPMDATSGGSVSFKRIKILVTSNQLNNTLFILRFELRKVSMNKQSQETIDMVQSEPMFVVSHTTLMKKPVVNPVQVATVSELIPAKGTSEGGTRVAILGNNFIDTPNARVWFDNIPVKPEFRGGKTLVCFSPRHEPGRAAVCVSNSIEYPSNQKNDAFFTYETQPNDNEHAVAQPVGHDLRMSVGLFGDPSNLSFSGLDIPTFDLDELDSRGYGLLHDAASIGNVPFAQQLIQKGANPNVLDKNGNSPLHWAVFYRKQEMICLLVKYGADLNLQNYDGESPLHWGCSAEGSAALAAGLISLGAWPHIQDVSGQTPLHYASAIGDLQTMVVLLRAGAPINVEDDEGDSPLHWATRENQSLAVRLLQQAGASGKLQNEDGETALHLAVELNEESLVSQLLQNSSRDQSSLNLLDGEGCSPLHLAVVQGNVSIAQLLINSGADVSLGKYTPLSLALQNEQKSIASLLVDSGAQKHTSSIETQLSRNLISQIATCNEAKPFAFMHQMVSIPTL